VAKYSAQLKATNNQGRTVTTSITNVNPEATSETILSFTQMLNSLTVNTYDSTDYIVTTNLDTEEPDIGKTEPTLTLTQPGEGRNGLTAAFLANAETGDRRYGAVTYNGDGTLHAYTDVVGAAVGITNQNGTQTQGTYVVLAPGWHLNELKPSSFSGKIYVAATAGDTYAAKTIELNIVEE